MRQLTVFENVSLDGYFSGENDDLGWAHKAGQDAEWDAFVAGNASGGGVLLLGRVTYEMMASYWPTPLAMKNQPEVARGINQQQKVVFSRTLNQASWSNTKLIKDDIVAATRRLKQEPGKPMTILGSGSIVSQLTQAGLIDGYQIVVNPVVLGKGRTVFEGVEDKLALRLTNTRTFGNGNVLLNYQRSA
jgi:dihydrofolate reductase